MMWFWLSFIGWTLLTVPVIAVVQDGYDDGAAVWPTSMLLVWIAAGCVWVHWVAA